MKEFENALVVEFPLRGEWQVPTTPGKSIPSHGTDQLGQRYAFDFVQVNWARKDKSFADSTMFRYLTVGVPLEKCYGYGREIYAPLGGRIIQAEDGVPERARLHLVRDLLLVLKSALTYNPHKTSLKTLLGNNVIMQCDDNVFAMFAHFKTGSVRVKVGEQVERGALLGEVGHSGNSTAPHLHFQLMDSGDLLVAKGLPCVFAEYEVYKEGKWEPRSNAVPTDQERVRFLGQQSGRA